MSGKTGVENHSDDTLSKLRNEFESVHSGCTGKASNVQDYKARPLVSVIIPTYNRALFLQEMLDSLAAQDYRPIEILIIDDGSTDDTPQIMAVASERLRRAGIDCHYILQAKSNGSCARNRGFRLSNGEYIIFVDSDDYLHPEMLSQMVGALERTNADFCVCDSARFRDFPGDSTEVKRLSSRRHTARAHLHSIALQTWFLARRLVIDSIGPWNEQLTDRDDVEYTFRILVGGFRGIWIPEVLYYWRKHDAQMSGCNDQSAMASSMLALNKMVAYSKLHNHHSWLMRIAFGIEFVRLAYACNRYGYTALEQQAKQLADEECLGSRALLYMYLIIRRIIGQKGIYYFRSR